MARPREIRPTTYWIDRPSQIEALASPIRHEILDRIAAEGPLSVRDVALRIGRRPTAVYHHVQQLAAQGLLRGVAASGKRGRPALLYETVAPRMRLARAGLKAKNHDALRRASAAAAKQAGRDHAAGLAAASRTLEGPARNHWFFRVVTSPSPARLARINRLLDELAELVWTPDPHPGPPMSVAWFLAPLPTKERKVP